MNTPQAVATRDDRMTQIEQKIDRDISKAISVGTGGITFQNAGEVMEYAKMMAVSGSAVPKHLRGQPGACLGIIDDAIRFHTSPYALARKSFFVNDNLAYEAQVIAGIVNRFAPLRERPDVQYEGEGGDRVCVVTFRFKDGSDRIYRSPKFKDINPKNSPLWTNDPDQQQAYYSLRAGARRHCPEIILGMYDIDEMRDAQMRDVTPREDAPVYQRLQQRQAVAEEQPEGFNRDFVADEVGKFTGENADPDTGEMITESDPDIPTASDGGSGNGAGSAEKPSSGGPAPHLPQPDDGDSIAQARARGAEARDKGMSRKAVPAEYRDGDAANPGPLTLAFQEGFDTGIVEDREPGAEG